MRVSKRAILVRASAFSSLCAISLDTGAIPSRESGYQSDQAETRWCVAVGTNACADTRGLTAPSLSICMPMVNCFLSSVEKTMDASKANVTKLEDFLLMAGDDLLRRLDVQRILCSALEKGNVEEGRRLLSGGGADPQYPTAIKIEFADDLTDNYE